MGPMLLFTGYRTPDHDLHAQEKASMVKAGILDQAFLALSRYPPTPKVNTCFIHSKLYLFFFYIKYC